MSLFNPNPLLLIDGYKADHRRQYPPGTQFVYSNFTPRKSRIPGQKEVVVFGLQYFLEEYLVHRFNEHFFYRPISRVIDEYRDTMDCYLGKGAIPVEHIEELHDYGHMPLKVKALPEGSLCPVGVPMLTIVNTNHNFFWLTNQLETLLSSTFWLGCTSATTAYMYRKRFNIAGVLAGLPKEYASYQGHDFSFRGMSSPESAMISAAGHLTSFLGTDTVPAIKFIETYYPGDNGVIGQSVPATEHSVQCAGGKENELATYRRLLTEVYPSGILSVVSDTWDFWSIVTDGVKSLYDDIMKRDGKLVIRPDSGDPVKIICGDPAAEEGSPAYKGAYECLWSLFPGEVTSTGFRQLDKHIGLIYGDAITLERQEAIHYGLMKKGFAPDVVLGIGSYSYQYVTRDTFGFAMKATHAVINGKDVELFKDPKTDNGEKRSAKGLLGVYRDSLDNIRLYDQCSREQEEGGLLQTVFQNGMLINPTTFSEVRFRLHGNNF